MRYYLGLICFMFFLNNPLILHSQNQSIARISNAITTSDSKDLSAYFSKQIVLLIKGNEYNCSKKQAQSIIKKFFTNHQLLKLTVIQQNVEKQSSYVIYRYTTINANYRFYVNLKTSDDGMKIFQIIIENEKE